MSKRKSLARLAVEKTQESQKLIEEISPTDCAKKSSSNARPLGHVGHGQLTAPSREQEGSQSFTNAPNERTLSPIVRRLPRRLVQVHGNERLPNRHSYPAAEAVPSAPAPSLGWQSPMHAPPKSAGPTQPGGPVSSPERRDPSRCQPGQVSPQQSPTKSRRTPAWSRRRLADVGHVLVPNGVLQSVAFSSKGGSGTPKNPSGHTSFADNKGCGDDLASPDRLCRGRASERSQVSGRSGARCASCDAAEAAARPGAPADAPAATLVLNGSAACSPAASAGSSSSAASAPPAGSALAHARSTNDLQVPGEGGPTLSPPADGSDWSSPLSVGHRARSFPAGLAGSMETLSSLSELSIGSPLSGITVQKARSRGYLVNTTGSALLLGSEELNACLPQRKVNLLVGTWNMNAKEPPGCLDDLVLPDSLAFVPDLVVLGTQESHADHRGLLVRLQSTLGPSHVLFHSAALGTLHLCIFIRRDLIWYCSVPEEASYSIRQPTAIKTKGCVAVGFQFFGTTFLLLTCHLTAHLEKQNQRIDDVRRICAALDLPQAVPSRSQSRDVTERYDNVLWFGDLNFRLSQSRPRVIDTIVEGSAGALLRHHLCPRVLQWDQLNQAKQKGRAFEGFSEGDIAFLPTYKYDPGTNTFDTSAKQRIPAYTDRILFKSRRDAVRCLKYDSVHAFNTSDHKPVWGLYQCDVRPSMDNIPLAAGKFDRSVFLEGLRRRARHVPAAQDSGGRPCSLQ